MGPFLVKGGRLRRALHAVRSCWASWLPLPSSAPLLPLCFTCPRKSGGERATACHREGEIGGRAGQRQELSPESLTMCALQGGVLRSGAIVSLLKGDEVLRRRGIVCRDPFAVLAPGWHLGNTVGTSPCLAETMPALVEQPWSMAAGVGLVVT